MMHKKGSFEFIKTIFRATFYIRCKMYCNVFIVKQHFNVMMRRFLLTSHSWAPHYIHQCADAHLQSHVSVIDCGRVSVGHVIHAAACLFIRVNGSQWVDLNREVGRPAETRTMSVSFLPRRTTPRLPSPVASPHQVFEEFMWVEEWTLPLHCCLISQISFFTFWLPL